MKYFLGKKSNRTNKVVFTNEADLNPKGRIVFGRCPAHGMLYVYIDIENIQARSGRLLPSDFFENIWTWKIVVSPVVKSK